MFLAWKELKHNKVRYALIIVLLTLLLFLSGLAKGLSAATSSKVTEGKGISEAGQIVLNNSFKEEGFQVGDKVKDAQPGYEMEVTGFTRNQM